MHIRTLIISNFKAIRHVELSGLERMVLIAGPNGCGKSCVFDALRLLKSTYGGYQPNEWQHWFGEFQINLNNNSSGLYYLFRDLNKPIVIQTEISISSREKSYIDTSLNRLAEKAAWDALVPESRGLAVRPIARDVHNFGPQVAERSSRMVDEVRRELVKETHTGRLEIKENGQIGVIQNPLLDLLFTTYDPQNIGIIDFHSANRTYQREQVAGINLSIESTDDVKRQSTLYNTASKYVNIKNELASTFVRDLIARAAGQEKGNQVTSLTETLSELFKTFFPDKVFAGPVPANDGSISFNVKTVTDGAVHDINDLSSGEKEVLFGYLRLRNSSPRDSVVLLDEPELHLNPALIKGLPQFYKRHVGEALDNQIWLITHSDAFLREATGQKNFSVYHMQPASRATALVNQAVRVAETEELELAIVDLVGDLATYSPLASVVIFEGENSEFDKRMTARLFPDLAKRASLVSAGSKTNARKLHGLLEEASKSGALKKKFYSIVDLDDSAASDATALAAMFRWPRYHIENFLLEPKYILKALQDVNITARRLDSEAGITEALRESARKTISSHVQHAIQNEANSKIVSSLLLRLNPNACDVTEDMLRALDASKQRYEEILKVALSREVLTKRASELQAELESSFEDESWCRRLRGRDILRFFVDTLNKKGFNYTILRDLILARMSDDSFAPPEMADIVSKIGA